MSQPVTIDGSYGEGGGQILRASVALAALTGRALVIQNIRAGRSKPGLAAQHLASVRAAAAICDGKLIGDAVGSQYLEMRPGGPVKAGHYHFEIQTAGAAPLVAQTVAVPLALADGPSTVTITGGTHVPMAPSADYLMEVFEPAMAACGLSIRTRCELAGFYPKGGGRLVLTLKGGERPSSLDWTQRGKLTEVRAIAVAPELPDHVTKRGLNAARKGLAGVGRPVVIERRELPGPFAGAAMLISGACQTGTFGFVSLGARGKPMEQVAEDAVAAFWSWFNAGAVTEEHLADQLVLPLAFAAGESRWTTQTASLHLETVLWLTAQFLPITSTITPQPDGTSLVTLRGVG